MVLKSLDLRFVYKAAAMILSIKSPDAMPLDRSATADRLSPCPNSLFAIARHPGRRSTSSQVALAGTQFHDRLAVDQNLYARRHAHRSLLFVPSRIRVPSGALTLMPISLCRLPTGTTTGNW
jgi:hypothetical protein